MILVEFFRDFLDGIFYFLYLIICIFAFFYVLGIVADRKREMIEEKLREKKQYDITSGKEAAIAALETKQVLSVDDAPEAGIGMQVQGANGQPMQQQQEEIPSVMVLNSNPTPQAPVANQAQMGQPMMQPQVAPAPLVQGQMVQPLVQGQMAQPMMPPMAQQGQMVAPLAQPQAQQPLVISSSGK